MKYIRHDCLAVEEPRINKIISIAGHAAYGVWNHLLEIIGKACEFPEQKSVTLLVEDWCEKIRLTLKEFRGYISLFRKYGLLNCEKAGDSLKIILLDWNLERKELSEGEKALPKYSGSLCQNYFISDIFPKLKEFGLRPEDLNDVDSIYRHCVTLFNTCYGDGTELYGWDEILTAWDHYTTIQWYNKSEDQQSWFMKRFRNAMTPMNVEFFYNKSEEEIASMQREMLEQTSWGREKLKEFKYESATKRTTFA